jgi:hypothetical protein
MTVMAFLGVLLLAAGPSPTGAQNVAIINGEIHTGSGVVLAKGTVLVENGVITAVGSDVQVPAGTRVVDAAGRVVTPAWVWWRWGPTRGPRMDPAATIR